MGRTAYRGYFPAFAFFLPTFAPLCLRVFLAPCSPTQIAPHIHKELNTVRRLLGWSAQETGSGVRAGLVPLGNLHAGEFVLFTLHISTGVGLPISSFLLLLLEDFGLQLQHLTPHSLLLTSIFVHLCEMFVGVRPCVILFRYFFILVRSGRSKDEVGVLLPDEE